MQVVRRLKSEFEARVSRPWRVAREKKSFETTSYTSANPQGAFSDFLDKYPEAATWHDAKGDTILIFATTCAQEDFCQRLLDLGADINAQGCQKNSALHMAAQMGDSAPDPTSGVKFLIARGAALETRNKFGETPLMFAMQRNKPWNVKTLILAGADPDIPRADGETPRQTAERCKGIIPELKAALEEGLAEKQRRVEQAAATAEQARRQADIDAAVAGISNGVSGTVTVGKPLLLKRLPA